MNAREQQFARLFVVCQQDLLRYILGCVPRQSDALDILQETASALWEKFDDYDPQQPFGPWARKFAHLQVMKYCLYRRREKQNLVAYSEQTQRALAQEYDEHAEVLQVRNEALTTCMDKLETGDRDLLKQRYYQRTSVREVAKKEGTNEDRLYRRLNRIRKALMKCINMHLAQGAVRDIS